MKIQIQHKMHISNGNINISKMQNTPLKKADSQRDSISIGSQARQLFNQHKQSNSLVESLMKQRESIQEMKSNLTERALEQGTDPSGLKEQMKALEQQLFEIDAQIAKAQKEKQEPTNTDTQKQSPQTAEEAIFSQANSLEQTKTLNRIDRSLSREKASLETEMKLDANRGVHSESKANRLTEIEEQISVVKESLTTEITENLSTNDEHKNEASNLQAEKLTVQEQLNKNTKGNDEDEESVSQV